VAEGGEGTAVKKAIAELRRRWNLSPGKEAQFAAAEVRVAARAIAGWPREQVTI